MKFKHTFHVFVDNFSVTYKQLLYRLVVGTIAALLTSLIIYEFAMQFINSESFNTLWTGSHDFVKKLLYGEMGELAKISENVRKAYDELITLVSTKMPELIISLLLILLVQIVAKWFDGLGNYASAAIINDKMTLHADLPFLSTLIRNLKEAAIYNAIYAPLSVIYDVAVGVGMLFLTFALVTSWLPVIFGIFLFTLVIVASITIKMTFTTDWLPAIIRGKKKQGEALKYAFSRKGKRTMNVMSNFAVLVLIIMGLNVAALFLTLGVGLLITIPASYVVIVTFELVNYYDREEIKYFIDKNTIVKPEKETVLSREKFFTDNEE
ncbi:MAG: hypothetical protein J1G05_04485 [Clostridiales bacterium]|nr:hypothetical protein [Clostridiales bacterium]